MFSSDSPLENPTLNPNCTQLKKNEKTLYIPNIYMKNGRKIESDTKKQIDMHKITAYLQDMTTHKPTKKDAELWARIKYELELRGHSFASIAKELGVGRQAVQSARRRSYPKMQEEIAKRLGTTAQELWPERYAPRERRPKHSRKKAVNQ